MSPTVATANNSDESGPVQSEDEALAADAAEFAKINDVSQKAAERALQDGAALGPVTGKLRALIGDREVSITKEYLPTTKLMVEISGREEIPGLDEVVASAPAPVSVTYTDKLSMEELHQALLEATKEWKKVNPGIIRTTIDDKDSSRILVVTSPAARIADEVDLRALAPAIPDDVQIVVSEETPETAPVLDSRGGLRLAVQGGDFACTSGFMGTKNSSGTKVLITAAHCPNPLRYISWAAGATWSNLNFQIAADNADVDGQTHLTGGAGTGQFWTGGSYRTVTSVTLRTNLAAGDFVCRFGMSSGHVCGNVESIHSTFGGGNYCNFGPCNNVWIATSAPTVPGDSGGPAYYLNSAIGIVKGHYDSLGVVGSISYVRSRLDVSIIGE